MAKPIPIAQYNQKGKLLRIFASQTEIYEKLRITVTTVLKQGYGTRMGCLWLYASDGTAVQQLPKAQVAYIGKS